MKKLSVLLKAIIIGFISCAVPGLSSLTFAIILCVYYPLIDAISSLGKNFKKSILYIICFFLGYCIGAVLAATLVNTIYDAYPAIIVIVIFGCILGSLPSLIKEILPYVKKWTNWLVMLLIFGFFAVYLTLVIKSDSIVLDYSSMGFLDYLELFGVALFTSITFALPGLDWAIVLLAFGYYYPLMELITNVVTFNDFIQNGLVLLTYVSGYMVGIFIFSKLIKLISVKAKGTLSFMTLSFVLVSPFMIVKKCIIDNINYTYTSSHIWIGCILAVISFIIVMLIYHLNDPNDTRIEATKKRHMLRFYLTILFKARVAHKYLMIMKKENKEHKMSFEEKYLLVEDMLEHVNNVGKISLHSYGEENLSNNTTLYVVNHQGRYDGMGVLTALKNRPTTLILGKANNNWPYYKEICEFLECGILDYQNPLDMVNSLKDVSVNLQNDRSYCAFIEGKYGNNMNNLQDFHTGIIRPAIDAKVSITPVVLFDTYKVYGKSSMRRIHPEVHFLKPITYEEYKNLEVSELTDLIKNDMQYKLDAIKEEKILEKLRSKMKKEI